MTTAAGPAIDVAALAEAHGDALLAFARGMLGSWPDAEDVVQETFLRAHREASTFRGACAPRTWLFTIARNACLDRLRTRSARSFTALEDVVARGIREAARPGALHVGADDAAHREQYVAAVRDGCLLGTLACLTNDQRAAFVLRTLTDLPADEVARVLDRSPNAVRVLVHRARARLKDFLCRRCSLWDQANPCRCDNLVAFSLARGWIGPDDAGTPGDRRLAEAAASAVDDVARMTTLYASACDGDARAEATARLHAALSRLDALAR